MSYFKKFPLITYKFDGKESVVRDILRRSVFISEYKPYTNLLTPYFIVDGDTPQSLALTLYGAATYHWVILMFNELHNPYFEWPLTPINLTRVCSDKYGPETMYMTKHYELNNIVIGEVKAFNKEMIWTPPDAVGESLAVSFLDYEERLNDRKRAINILRPELLGEFVKQFELSING